MARHPATIRPFRGSTPEKIFQTVDVGSGWAATNYIYRRAARHPKRQYAALEMGAHPEAVSANVEKAKDALMFFREMIRQGKKTRHINIDMPLPSMGIDFLHTILTQGIAAQVLPPNGKIFVTTEAWGTFKEWGLKDDAINNGFSLTLKRVPKAEAQHRTNYTGYATRAGDPLYRLILTRRLKTAIPDKRKRTGY